MRRLLVSAVLLAALTPSSAVLAQPAPPVLTEPVNDFARVIDSDSKRELDRRIRALQKASGDTVAVATVRTYQPYGDIKEYAVKMFENAGKGIGERAKDNGLLIVVAIEDRQVAIEVGYGLEPFITDGFSGDTIREFMRPSFRAGQYGKGLLAGATRLINRIADERAVTLQDVPVEAPAARRPPVEIDYRGVLFIVIAILVIMAIAGRSSRRRRRRWGGGPWSGWNSGIGPFGGGMGGFGGGFGGFGGGGGGGGGFGGFGGFGGGRSGGGGATGGW